jgi:DUF4097 and DUF4098 domain-containing protein YvlB
MRARFSILPAAGLALLIAIPAAAGTFTKSFSTAARASVHVEADDASIRVASSEVPQVDLRVEYEGYVLGKSLRIDARQDGDRVELSAKEPRRVGLAFGVNRKRVQIEVRMPRDGDLRIETGDGRVDLSSVHGDIRVSSGDGELTAERLEGKISLQTGDGRIRVDSLKGEFALNTGDGGIEGTHLDGLCRVSTGDGRVRLSGRFDALDIRSGDGGIEALAAAGSKISAGWTLRSGDGTVTLALPAEFQARLDASTGDGPITLGMPVAIDGRLKPTHVQGTLNGGGATLSIHTGDGGIRIDRS